MENLACMYLRLSKEDRDNNESNSISNQRELIKSFSYKNNIKIVSEYVDDGYSGTSFKRPGFIQMINDLNEGKFSTIIVKDLSRLGRDYIESGRYIQKIFPSMGVRFISINDNYDSDNSNVNDTHFILPIKNFINDSYCRDISIKVKTSKRSKQERGEFVGAFAPFGYKKDPSNKHRFIIDNQVDHIIKKIFDMKIEGYSSNGIADFLNNMGYVTPLKHKNNLGNKKRYSFSKDGNKWCAKMINRIITNNVYIGTLEQCKSVKINHKSDKRIIIDKQNWISKENMHEGIVSKLKFNLANKMLVRDLRGTPDVLSGILFCKYCGSQVTKRTIIHDGIKHIYYTCLGNKYKNHSTYKVSVDDVVLLIKKIVQGYLTTYKMLIRKLNNIDVHKIESDYSCNNLINDKNKYMKLYNSLHVDLDDGLIDEKEFKNYRLMYSNKIKDIDDKIKFRKTIIDELFQEISSEKIVSASNKFKNELDRFTLVSLIDRVEIGKDQDFNVIFNDYTKLNLIKEILNDYTPELEVVNNG